MNRRHPIDIPDARLHDVLAKYVPPIIARSIVERARREAATGPDVSWTDPNGLLDRIAVGVRLFAAPEHQSAILREITDLAVAERDDLPTGLRLLDDAPPASTRVPSSRSLLDDLPPRAREDTARSREDTASTRVPSSRSLLDDLPPRTRDDLPRTRDDLPRTRDDLPRNRDELPRSRDELPRSRDDLPPRTRDDLPRTRDDLPRSRDELPRSRDDLPRSRDVVPLTPPSSPASPTSRRDADPIVPPIRRVAPTETPPSNRGVFGSGARHPSGAMRIPAARPSSSSAAGGTPPPPAVGLRSRPTPVSGTPAQKLPPPPDRPADSRDITLTLSSEHDIPRARQVVREICESLSTRALTQQRLVTIVSELGRNMVLYAGGGKITLRPPVAPARRVVVIAVDQGSGIPNLPEILAGKYKSRTGLGLGIVGTKRLADAFHIETGRHGTSISVEVIV